MLLVNENLKTESASFVDIKNGAIIIQEVFNDPLETGNKNRYQTVECLIYVGWPILATVIIGLFFSNLSLISLLFIGSAILLWPYVKGLIGLAIAKIRRIKDPRHTIRSSSFWFDGFLFIGSPMLREIRQYSALSRSLDVIYNAFERFGIKPAKFSQDWENKITPFRIVNKLIKTWSIFWVGMPIAQDVRSRLEIIADEYRRTINRLAAKNPGRKISILEVAGGQLQATMMGIRRAIDDGSKFEYHVVSVEPDSLFARERARELIGIFKLDEKCFKFISSNVSTSRAEKYLSNILFQNGVQSERFNIITCIGLGDYYYTPKRIKALLASFGINGHAKIITANIADNFIERPFLHILIQWPKMKYRSDKEWRNILFEAYKGRGIRVIQTPHRIFNIAVIE
ncbi:MAG: hypothetical protein WC639_02630 [Patescibacteria group bacterium]|jgi:hypothetical protein